MRLSRVFDPKKQLSTDDMRARAKTGGVDRGPFQKIQYHGTTTAGFISTMLLVAFNSALVTGAGTAWVFEQLALVRHRSHGKSLRNTYSVNDGR